MRSNGRLYLGVWLFDSYIIVHCIAMSPPLNQMRCFENIRYVQIDSSPYSHIFFLFFFFKSVHWQDFLLAGETEHLAKAGEGTLQDRD